MNRPSDTSTAPTLISVCAGDKTGIVCCSNGLPARNRTLLQRLSGLLEQAGLIPVFSPYIYAKDGVFSGSARDRARALMDFYQDPAVTSIFDVSGGDIANEILPWLDFDIIASHPKLFAGYSDLTTVINAIYTKTGQPCLLYQLKNLLSEKESWQAAFFDTLLHHKTPLSVFPYIFVQGDSMEGIVTGGNIRCLLKLAGTEYFPDLNRKLLLLEAFHGGVPQMTTYLSQLQMMGAFSRVNGIILGTFTEMEQEQYQPDILSLVQAYAGSLPVIKTPKIGHGTDSCAIMIGSYQKFRRQADTSI